MLKHALVWASLMTLMTAGSGNAQQPLNAVLGITQTPQQQVQLPGINYKFVLGSFEFSPGGSVSTDALLTALVTWISDNFDLPPVYDHPRVLPMSSVEMTNLLYQSVLGARSHELSKQESQGQSDQQRLVVSLYNRPTKTIYLPPEWTGRTPAELSVLVHEMVHHLQNVAHIAYGCSPEREKIAYEAQEKWLGLFGHSLSNDFGIDPFTLLLTTRCHVEIAD